MIFKHQPFFLQIMKIAILGDALDLQYAGIHTYTRELVRALARFDRENEYFVVRPRAGGELEGVREIVVPIARNIPGHQRLRGFTSIPRCLVRAGVDVVVEPAHFGPFCLPRRIKRITVIQDITPVLSPQFHLAVGSVVQRVALPFIFKRADCIVASSASTQRDIEKHYPLSKGKVRLVLPGRETAFRQVQDWAVLEKYGIRQPYLLTVGTIEPRKNLCTALRAYELFRQDSEQQMQWVIAGKSGWKNGDFYRALDASPFRSDVVLTGYTERQELPALYSMARLFVFPSLYEGFGLPVLEAMSCGAPVLVSNASSLPEVGGDAARYFEPNSVAELATQLSTLLRDEQELLEMSKSSLQQALKFDWEKTAEQFVSIFQKVSGGSGECI